MTISEFLKKGPYYDPKVPLGLLMDDSGVECIGIEASEYNVLTEIHILYKFPRDTEGIGDYLKTLGCLINQIPLEPGDSLGIQEVDLTQPNEYYVMFYLLRELTPDNK